MELAVPEKIELLATTLARRVSILPAVRSVHQSGLTVRVELDWRGPGEPPVAEVALAARRRGASVHVRGASIVLAPPASSTGDDLRRLVAILASSIAEASVGRMPAAA